MSHLYQYGKPGHLSEALSLVITFYRTAWHHGFPLAIRVLSLDAFGIDPRHPRRELPGEWLRP